MMDKTQLASAAMSLVTNEAAIAALGTMRKNAVEGLVAVAATDTDKIRDLQSTIRVIDEFSNRLSGMIRAAGSGTAAGIV